MSRLGRPILLFMVGLLAIAGITGALAGPGGVLRGSSDGPSAVTPAMDIVTPDQIVAASAPVSGHSSDVEVVGDIIECASGGDTRSRFEMEGDQFEVTGLLVSLDIVGVVVAGPSGDVAAVVNDDTEVKGGPVPGEPVKMEGSLQGDSGYLAREIEPACEDEDDVHDDANDNDGEHQDDDQEVVSDFIECPSGKQVQVKFEQHDGKFEVKGALVSLNGTVVVTGPNGDVTAAVDANAEIKGDLQPGDAVEVEGWMQEDGSLLAREIKAECHEDDDEHNVVDDVITCPSGKQVQVKFEQHDGKFEVKGALVSLNGTVVVTGPNGDVTATVDANADIKGDPQPGDAVEVEGRVQEDGSLLAHEIEAECEQHEDDQDGDSHPDDDDDDHEDDHRHHDDDDHGDDHRHHDDD